MVLSTALYSQVKPIISYPVGS